MASDRLPRVAHCEKVREGETVFKQTGADLQNGWLGRHGTLYLTDHRILFVPTMLDTALRARRREMLLEEIVEIERWPIRGGAMPPGGKRPRMIIRTRECGYEFMVGDLDGWIDAAERIFEIRSKNGHGDGPRVLREGHVNVFLSGD